MCVIKDGMIDELPLSHVAHMGAQNSHFVPEHHEGVNAPWHGLITSEVEHPLEDHFSFTLMDNVVLYGHQVGPAVMEVSVEMQQLAEEELQSMVVDFLSFVDSPTLLW